MGNEMGNRNVSGIQEEENTTAIEVPAKFSQEADFVDEVKGENHIIPEAEGKDFHEKSSELSSNDTSDAQDPQVEKHILGEREQADTELKPPSQSSEVKSDIAVSQESQILRASSPEDEGSHEKPPVSNLVDNRLGTDDQQIQKQPPTGAEEEETSNSIFNIESASHDVGPNSNQQEPIEKHPEPLLEDNSMSPNGKKIPGSSLSCLDEKVHLMNTEEAQYPVVSDVSDTDDLSIEQKEDDLLIKEIKSQEEKILDQSISEEKCEISSEVEAGNDLSQITTAPTFSHGSLIKHDGYLPPEIDLKKYDSSDSFSASVPWTNSLDYLKEVSKTEENGMVVMEETKIGENNFEELDPDEANACQSEKIMTGYDYESVEKEILDISNSSVVKKAHHIEEGKVTDNGNQNYLGFDYYNLNSVMGEQCKDSEEAIQKKPEIGTIPTELTVTADNHEEENPVEKNTTSKLEIEEKATENCSSQAHWTNQEQSLLSLSPASPFEPQYSTDDTALIADVIQQSCREFVLPNVSIGDARINAMKPKFISAIDMKNLEPEKELEMNVKTKLVKVEVEDNGRRFSADENPHTNNHVELRKSPSFHFDLSLGARSEESGQTPLLYHKTRKTRCDRDVIQYEEVPVEEKTIRMERSDSENPRAPSLSLLIKEEKANTLAATQKQESHAGDKEAKDSLASSPKEVALTRVRRKPRASLFSTCICCAAAIH